VRNENALDESETQDGLLTDMIKATRNLIESSKYERAEEDTTFIHGYTSPINSKGFKNLANTVDNLIGMSRNTNVSDKIKHAALELKERFF
jgi:hypothetical protein